MDWDVIKADLDKKLDPAAVRPAPRGKFGDYVDGYHVITEANRIFGHGGWSYEVTRLERVSEQTVQIRDKAGNPADQFRVGYLCAVRVNIGGVYREGVAVGSGVGNPDTQADHHESAVKEAETDALKRALRCFGNTFGLALYDKTKANVGVDFDASATRDRIKKAVEKAESLDELAHVWKVEADSLVDLRSNDPPKFNECNTAKDARKKELTK